MKINNCITSLDISFVLTESDLGCIWTELFQTNIPVLHVRAQGVHTGSHCPNPYT